MKHIQLLSQNLRLINYFYTKSLDKELSSMKADYHFEALLVLADQEHPITQNQLAELLHIDKSRVANIVFSMEEQEIIIVKTNPADRRQHLISLSPKAVKSIPGIEKTVEEVNRMANLGISEEKLAVFKEVTEAMMHNLIKK
ncbi:MarR family winged helix-turn-helix transcriptional regulator [Mucilaginibacter agri]|uniref:MarR family transcriptional regulator n=1 Tax=Mucilaginibacter agri TaxID=2695265 RepID=A0A966DTC9_9SPHI|nr:MarR family transcriptional regulator [Mucilaginibacter agri]NCD71123.1 MarR family transcriptional regulator [Mucilaginibacter agri]